MSQIRGSICKNSFQTLKRFKSVVPLGRLLFLKWSTKIEELVYYSISSMDVPIINFTCTLFAFLSMFLHFYLSSDNRFARNKTKQKIVIFDSQAKSRRKIVKTKIYSIFSFVEKRFMRLFLTAFFILLSYASPKRYIQVFLT